MVVGVLYGVIKKLRGECWKVLWVGCCLFLLGGYGEVVNSLVLLMFFLFVVLKVVCCWCGGSDCVCCL